MLRYFRGGASAFDPHTLDILSGALERAWEIARTKQVSVKLDGHAEAVRDLLARHIIDLAQQGERDSQRLISGALDRLKL
jgi:hypothetical protein